jgi:hypothetical protein
MQIAKQVYGINVGKNAMILFKDGSLANITKRFDVKPDGSKLNQRFTAHGQEVFFSLLLYSQVC